MSHSTTTHSSWRTSDFEVPTLGTKKREGDWLVSRGCVMINPEGWLLDPKRRWLLFFHRDPKSAQRLPLFYMDKWNVSPIGTPNTFIDRRKVHQGPAKETWDELIQNGWERTQHQFGEAA